jgi:hypothetical protein
MFWDSLKDVGTPVEVRSCWSASIADVLAAAYVESCWQACLKKKKRQAKIKK